MSIKTTTVRKILRNIYDNFRRKRFDSTKDELTDLAKGFPQNQKQGIINEALTTASQILISACIMTNSHEYIEGEVTFPDNSKWIISFRQVTNVSNQINK